jgi:hypothetical protein
MIDRTSRTTNGNGFVIKAHLGPVLGWITVSESYPTWEHAGGVLALVPVQVLEAYTLQVFESLSYAVH